MSKSLPRSKFKWLNPEKFNLDKYKDDTLRGCVLEVNLEYPKELHELRSDHPLVLDKLEIKKEILSDYQLKIVDDFKISISNVKKLVPSVFVEEKYVLHHKNLQLYLSLRLKMKKTHRVLEFDSPKGLKS